MTRALVIAALVVGAMSCSTSPTSPAGTATFVVDVVGERFLLRLSDPATIQLAEDNLAGRNQKFPAGPLLSGNGGFNAPWSWHLDPAETRFVDFAIEVCDGLPSYVETHRDGFPTYCPWGARVVSRRR